MVMTQEKIIFDGQRFLIPGVTPPIVVKVVPSLAETIEKLGIEVKKAQISHDKMVNSEVNPWFYGKIFVLSGKMYGYNRVTLIQMINKKGGIVKPDVAKNTDYLLIGNKPGIKYYAAIKHSVELVYAEKFFDQYYK